MINVFDLKVKNNYNFILPSETIMNEDVIDYSRVLIVIHLFYTDNLEYYFDYIRKIPKEITILFTYPDDIMFKKLKMFAGTYSLNCQYKYKENRGRDLSALLVAAADEIIKYEYVCFLHDKTPKRPIDKEDTSLFVECLWHNMLATNIYIRNILYLLNSHEEIGLLLPPESMSNNFCFVQKNTWDDDYELMEQIVSDSGIKCNLDKDKKPISLGTVFWAKVDAIKKLLDMNWKYSDFTAEPMPLDGTISHALERSFAYFAQDAGYATGVVMTDKYAGHRMDICQDYIYQAFKILRDEFDITNYTQMMEWINNRHSTPGYISCYSRRYIYGAGRYGRMCEKGMLLDGIIPSGFLVSDMKNNQTEIDGYPVKLYSSVEIDDNTCIIIAVHERYVRDVLQNVLKTDINKNNIFFFPWMVDDCEK